VRMIWTTCSWRKAWFLMGRMSMVVQVLLWSLRVVLVLRSLIAKALLSPPYLLLPLRLVDYLLVPLEPTWCHELEKEEDALKK
jgi:hypothetical protein